MDSRLLLPKDTLLDSAYRVTRVLGAGGFGITYEAEDVNLGMKVALKEYYPFDFGDRDATMSVRPKSERHRQTFEWGRSSFLQEARMLARFDHRSIVRVARVFEANSTAYMVMRLEQGKSFEAWLDSLGRPPTQEELDRIATALLDALEMMHAESFLHRDIAPDNIIVRADGSPVLLDFGAARRAVGEMSRMLTGIVKAGYSPQEQYATDGRLQGPWTDFYALGGVLYRAMTGKPPEEKSTLRAIDDHMPSAAQAAKGTYRPSFLAAIDACLAVRHTDRPQSVAQLRAMLQGEGPPAKPTPQRIATAGKRQTDPLPTPKSVAPVARPAGRWWLIIAATLMLAGGAYGGLEYTRWSGEQDRKLQADTQRRQDERAGAERRAAEERTRQEAEAKRLADADAAATKKRADEEALAQARAEAKRLEEERLAAERRVAEQRARQEAEAKRLADAAAVKRKTDEEALAPARAEAKRLEEERLSAEKRAADERARQADAQRKAQEARVAAETRAITEKANQSAQAERDFQDGERYLYGRGVPRDYPRARQGYEKAAAAGHSGGMTGLGWVYENGLSVPKDYAKARELYEKAAAAGNTFGTNNLGRLYRNGWGVPRDYAKARELFEKAAAAGNGNGMSNVGWLYHNGWGVPRDYAKARDWYEKAVAKGNGFGMNNLGVLYRDGLGVPRDFSKARELFERAVAVGNDFGMYNLGWLHENGWGVARDYIKAREWHEKAAAAGNAFGMAHLGWLYRQGWGGPQDFAKAREWSEKAVALGNGPGMNNLGVFHENGNGVPQSYLKAREWYEKAAAAGNTFGMRNMARMLDQGGGGPADAARAAKLLLEAARLNNPPAVEDLRGPMTKWSSKTRGELKRELLALGHYQGPVNDTWDNDARAAVNKLLTAGK